MNAQDAIAQTMKTSSMILTSYLSDMSDADLMTRPGPGCQHVAWQLGHLIASESTLLESISPGSAAPLPDGFAEQHSKETIADDDPAHFHSKQEYLDLLEMVNDATLGALKNTTEEDLDGPSPEHFRKMFPTVGAIYVLIASHGLMHSGQMVPVRRALEKPILI